MSLWDLLLVAVLGQMTKGKVGPKWPGPGPTGPTGPGPGPTGPTGPGPGPTGPTGPGPVQTTWKPYFYVQPDAGEKFGTPYALAGEWHGQGTAWTQMWNFTRSRPLSQGDGGGGGAGVAVVPPGDDTTTGYIASGKNYAYKGDKLLIPWTWPEPKAPAILARLQTIPPGTTLPGVSQRMKLSGDETPETI